MSSIIIGQGGIGTALADRIDGAIRWSRPEVDPTDEASIVRAAEKLDSVDLAIVTTEGSVAGASVSIEASSIGTIPPSFTRSGSLASGAGIDARLPPS